MIWQKKKLNCIDWPQLLAWVISQRSLEKASHQPNMKISPYSARCTFKNSSEIRAGSDNIQRSPDFTLWCCDTLTDSDERRRKSSSSFVFSCKIKGEGKIGGWVKGGWNRPTTQTNLLFLKVTNHNDKKPLFSYMEFWTVQYEIMGGSFIVDLRDSWGSWVSTVFWTHNGSIEDRHQHSESHNSTWIKVLNGCCILALFFCQLGHANRNTSND